MSNTETVPSFFRNSSVVQVSLSSRSSSWKKRDSQEWGLTFKFEFLSSVSMSISVGAGVEMGAELELVLELAADMESR